MKQIIVVLISMVCFTSIQASIHIVTNTNDNGIGSLRHTINLASPYDTIRFSSSIASTTSDTIFLDSSLTINKPLKIIGKRNGAIELFISGRNTTNLFEMSGVGNSYIDSLYIVDGFWNTNFAKGGAITFNGDTLFLNFVRLQNNFAKSGGAISGTNIHVKNCTFFNNGGGNRGAAIFASSSLYSFKSNFLFNYAWQLNSRGIVIYVTGNATLIQSQIEKNTTLSSNPLSAVLVGGVVNGEVIVDNCSFFDNDGCGISVSASETKFDNTAIIGNSKGGLVFDGLTSSKKNIFIENSTISKNRDGSGISLNDAGNIWLKNSTISKNKGSGGVSLVNVDSVNFNNVLIDSNINSFGGGGVFINGIHDVEFTNCDLTRNVANNEAVMATSYEGGSALYSIGGTSYSFNHCVFSKNTINPRGTRNNYTGAMTIQVGADSIHSILNISNCTFDNNHSFFSSAINYNVLGHWSSSTFTKGNINITNSTFTRNGASRGYLISGYAGSSVNNYMDVSIKNSTIYNNLSNDKLFFAGTNTSATGQSKSKITIESSIVMNTDSNNFEADSLISMGYNLMSDSLITIPHSMDSYFVDSSQVALDTLGWNGGLTLTLLPLPSSIAINNGNPTDVSDAQNGSVIDSRRDIGACEAGAGVGIEENKSTLHNVELFPNPTSQFVTLRFNEPISEVSISVYDLTGKMVLKANANNTSQLIFDTQELLPGLYLVNIQARNETITKRLVKQ